MKYLNDVLRGNPEWIWGNPEKAPQEFVSKNSGFIIEQTEWVSNERAYRGYYSLAWGIFETQMNSLLITVRSLI